MAARHIRHGGTLDPASGEAGVPDTVEHTAGEVAPATVAGLSRFHAITHYVSRRDGRRRTSVTRTVIVAVAIVVVTAAALAIAYLTHVSEALTAGVDDRLAEVLATHEGNEPFYLLLVGIDHNSGLAGADGGARQADAVIVARIDTRERLVTLVSVPRDTLVATDDGTLLRVGDAYAIGGASLLTQAVSELVGIGVTHYAEMDFDGFAATVDHVGGIDVTLPVAMSDPGFTGIELSRGPVHLDGYGALMLVRCLHAYDGYDDAEQYRAANQRAALTALARAALGRGTLSLPGTLAALAGQLTCDMDALAALDLTLRLHGIDADDVLSAQLPTTDVFVNGSWYERLDDEAWGSMLERVEAGMAPYERVGDDPTRGIAGTATLGDDDADGPVVEPEYGGTVSVLNATDTEGLAAGAAEKLASRGFEASASNAADHADVSRVWYNGDDAIAKAVGVAEILGIEGEPAANDGTLPADANVVVVLGADVA